MRIHVDKLAGLGAFLESRRWPRLPPTSPQDLAYSENTLSETLATLRAYTGVRRRVAEYQWSRRCELELARAQGDDALQPPGRQALPTGLGALGARAPRLLA